MSPDRPGGVPLRDLITTGVELVGMLAVAVFVGAGLTRWIGPFGYACGGAVLLVESWWMTTVGAPDYVPVRKRTVAAWRRRRARAAAQRSERRARRAAAA